MKYATLWLTFSIDHLAQAWSQVTDKKMRGVGKPILKRDEEAQELPVDEIIEDIVNLGNELDIGYLPRAYQSA